MKEHQKHKQKQPTSNADAVAKANGTASFLPPPPLQYKVAEEEKGKQLRASVGYKCQNLASDVRLVQAALHRASYLSTASLQAETPAASQCDDSDSVAAASMPHTIAAIHSFQKEIGITDATAQGRILNGYKTWTALQKSANKNAFVGEGDTITLQVTDPQTILYIEVDDWLHAIPLADVFPAAKGEISLSKEALAAAFGVNLPDRIYAVSPNDEYFHLIKSLLPDEPEICAGSLGGNLAILVEMFQKTMGQIPAGEWAPPGKQPIPLYIGRAVHEAIGEYYKTMHFPSNVNKIFTNDLNIFGILKRLGRADLSGNISPSEGLLKPDILDTNLGQLYEIKPANAQNEAVSKMLNYIRILTKAGLTVLPGSSADLGVHGAIPAPEGVATFFSPIPGVIIYRMNKHQKKPAVQPNPEPLTAPKTYDPTFLEYMEKVTGLAGTALIIYIIISEGSRLFSPRNLVPIP